MVSIGVRVMIFCGIISYMQSLPNEQQLVTQAQQGSKEAVSALYEFYAQPIFRYISYRVESDMIAEDLAADVFLRMVQKLRQYRYTGAPFGALPITIVREIAPKQKPFRKRIRPMIPTLLAKLRSARSATICGRRSGRCRKIIKLC
jgi:DNA-directed RNA polymerase specialized sigma24 family protein